MRKVYYCFLLLLTATLCFYGLHCAWHLHAYIGTGHYWSNMWFYKAHATLIVIMMVRLLILPLEKK